MAPLNFRRSLIDKIKDRYTPAEFVELIELDFDDLTDFIVNDMTDIQLSALLEDMRITETDEDDC